MPAVIPVDPEKVVVDVVYGLLDVVSDFDGFKVGTRVTDGVTPHNFVQVRMAGGNSVDTIADRVRLDVRVWTDGTINTEAQRSRVARALVGHLRKALPCRVFASPIPLPDPADNTKNLTLFSIELLLRGTQLP